MSKTFIVLLLFYGVVMYAMSFQVTKAYFHDSTTSMNNSFLTAQTFPTLTPSITVTPTQIPEPDIATHIVISEVQIAGVSESGNDFIELYNPTTTPISLDTYSLVKRNSAGTEESIYAASSFTAADIIPANGYFLWANSANGFSTSVNANISSADTLTANNSVALRNNSLDVDKVAWGSSSNPLIEGIAFGSNPSAGQSIERKAKSSSSSTDMGSGGIDQTKGNGYDSNNNASDFVLRTAAQPQNSGSGAESL